MKLCYHKLSSSVLLLSYSLHISGHQEELKHVKQEKRKRHTKYLQHIKHPKRNVKPIKHLPPSLGKQYLAPQSLGPQVAPHLRSGEQIFTFSYTLYSPYIHLIFTSSHTLWPHTSAVASKYSPATSFPPRTIIYLFAAAYSAGPRPQ